MAKQTLHTFYLELFPNLLREFYFFIPENQSSKDIIEKVDAFKKYVCLNEVYVIDYYKGPILYTTDRNPIEATLKSSKLEKNIFSLVEKKSEVKPDEFNYVLKKYFEFVESLFYITDWMNLNIKWYAKEVTSIKGLFYLQFINYKKHFEALVKEFYPNEESSPKGNFNAHKMINSYFHDISKGFKVITPIATTVNDTFRDKPLQTLSNTLKESLNKTKIPLVTEEEVENMLLKTFFNIGK